MKSTMRILAEGLLMGVGFIAIKRIKANPESFQKAREFTDNLTAVFAEPIPAPFTTGDERRLTSALEALEEKLGGRQLIILLEGISGTAPNNPC